MNRFQYAFPLLIAISCSTLFALEPPKDPSVPEVAIPSSDIELRTTRNISSLRTMAVFGDSSTNILYLRLAATEFDLIAEAAGETKKIRVTLTNLSRLDFLSWKGFPQKDGGTIFYPLRTRITLKDGSSFECSYYLREFGKIPARTATGDLTLYSYFYEYREKGRWKNSGKKELTYPETHPAPKCVKSLILL